MASFFDWGFSPRARASRVAGLSRLAIRDAFSKASAMRRYKGLRSGSLPSLVTAMYGVWILTTAS
jgi:hypothetical protein